MALWQCELRRVRSLAPVMVVIAACVHCAAPASAQLSNLSVDDFIGGLEDWGLNDLIIYYIKKYPPAEPIDQQLVIIKQHELVFDDALREPADREAAFNEARRQYQALLAAVPDGGDPDTWETQWFRWGTDCGALLQRMLEYREFAGQFVEFGVPTEAQRQLFMDLSTEAAEVLNAAFEDHWLTMSTLITRHDDFDAVYRNTGRWDRMERYGKVLLPLYRSEAMLHAALQGDEGPYFQRRADEAKRDRASFDPATQRARMLRTSLRMLEDLAVEALAEDYGIDARISSLSGRTKLAMNRYDDAIVDLEQAIATAQNPAIRLFARFAKVQALERAGQLEAAREELAVIRDDPAVTENPLMMVMLADREHLMIQAEAAGLPSGDAEADAQRAQRVRASYQPYTRLLNDPLLMAMGSEMVDVIKDYLFTRFAESLDANADMSQLPDMVLLAVGTKAMQAGRKQAAEEIEAARLKFDRAVDVLDQLLRRTGVSDGIRSEGLYTLAVTHYSIGESIDPAATVRAAETFVDLADAHADQPIGATSIDYALQLSRPLYQANRTNERAASLYRRALEVLLVRYDLTPVADRERYSYAALLREQKQYEPAIEAFDNVADDHPFRAEAMYEKVVCLRELWSQADRAAKRRRAQELVDAADAYLSGASRAIVVAEAPRQDRLRRYEGDALVMKCDAMIESLGQADAAVAELTDFDHDYREYPQLVSQAIRLRIRVHQRQRQYAAAKQQIDHLLERFPDQAGPVMDGVIASLFLEIEDLQQQPGDQEADELIDLAVVLTVELLNWAKDQPEWTNRTLVFELMAGRAELHARQFSSAIERYRQLYADVPRDADVIEGFADACFGAGAKRYGPDAKDPTAMPGAARLYNRLIGELPEGGTPRFWKAWARTLTIADELLAGRTDQAIATRIRRLRAEYDDDLGGERYRGIFERLQSRHSR